MLSSLFGHSLEGKVPEHFALQNSKMLRVLLNGEVLARQGSMVAFQGQMDFEHQGSGGLGKMLKKAVSGEGAPLMKARGQGQIFFANNADEIHLVFLQNEAISVNGTNILAFEQSLQWDISTIGGGAAGMLAGGVFNTLLQGTGWVALTSHGTPVILNTAQAPTFADAQAAICWSANLETNMNSTFKAGALIGRGSGEMAQIQFNGQGFVIVQASEGPVVPPHSHNSGVG